MRVLMTGGGTAGHVNPAIAIANTIKEYEKDSEIAFVASNLPRDKAADLVPRAGYVLHRVDICGHYQIWNPKNLKTLYLMLKSRGQAKKIIREFHPDVIIGTGGFACYPVLNVGAEMGIPTIVHESNAIAGKAVLRLAPKIDCVMTNFESTKAQIKRAKAVINVGNPMVIKSHAASAVQEKGEFSGSVLSFGGSLGSETLNRAVCKMISALADKYKNIQFYHAAGKRDYEKLKREFEKCGLLAKENVVLVDYIYDMDARMKTADLVISRAGAMSLSELALLGKAAVLVPSPYVADNHQFKNAKALYDKGACALVEEKDFENGKLEVTVDRLLSNERQRREMSEKIKCFAKPDANRIIYDEIKKTVVAKKQEM